MTTNCTKAPALGLPLGAFVCCSDAQKEPFTFLVQITTSSVTTLPTTFTFVHQCQSNASQWLKQMESSIVAVISDMKETISAKLEALALTPTSSWRKRTGRAAGSRSLRTVSEYTDSGAVRHLSRDCQSKIEKKQNEVELSKNKRAELKCFNCGEKGHDATRCPSKVLAATGTHVERLLHGREKKLTCKGMVEQRLLWSTLFWIRDAQEQWCEQC
eukprot:Em0005g698a